MMFLLPILAGLAWLTATSALGQLQFFESDLWFLGNLGAASILAVSGVQTALACGLLGVLASLALISLVILLIISALVV